MGSGGRHRVPLASPGACLKLQAQRRHTMPPGPPALSAARLQSPEGDWFQAHVPSAPGQSRRWPGLLPQDAGCQEGLDDPHTTRPRSPRNRGCYEFLPQGHFWPKTNGKGESLSAPCWLPHLPRACRLLHQEGPRGFLGWLAAPGPPGIPGELCQVGQQL